MSGELPVKSSERAERAGSFSDLSNLKLTTSAADDKTGADEVLVGVELGAAGPVAPPPPPPPQETVNVNVRITRIVTKK